jgi:penicillin-binding protein 2
MMRPDSGARLGSGSDATLEIRLPFVMVLVALPFLLFTLRLFQLQILQGEQYEGIAHGNAVRMVRLEAPRGDILDREGRVLATARPAFGVTVMPSDLRTPETTFAALGQLIDAEPAALSEKVGSPRGRRRFQAVRLAGDLTVDHRARVEAHLYALPGINTDVRPRRDYVEGEFASHLLGTIGEIRRDQLQSGAYGGYRAGEVIGQSGVEKRLETDLRGKAGGRNVVVDVAGRVVKLLDEHKPEPGRSVTLTLDRDLQRVAEAGFLPEVLGAHAPMGAVVAMDPRNGDVLALVSKPGFDPNDFAGGIDTETWQKLTGDEWKPLQNRAISGVYPPGSAYKPVVAAAGLEDGLVTPETKKFCPGHFRLGRRTYRCWRRAGHGWVDLHDALKMSCDVYFYELGRDLGIDRIADFARRFRFGHRTGIRLANEKGGLVPTKKWKERRFGEPWVGGETISASIGQGYNLSTPIQLTVAYAALANGGVIVKPRIVLRRETREGVVEAGEPEVVGNLGLAPEHLQAILGGLEAVVGEQRGTGGRSRVPGVRVAGKTGTAQVVGMKHTEDLEEDEIPIRNRDHAWFVAFAPVEAPEIVVSVLVEHGGHGGSAAAPIAQKVLARYFEKQRERNEEAVAALAAEALGAPAPAAPEGGATP